MPQTPMPSPRGTNRANLFLPQSWPANPTMAMDSALPPRLARIARDQSLDSNDVLSLFKILLSGIDPSERDNFKDQLLDLLDAEQPGTTEQAPDKRPPGADRRVATDTAPPPAKSFAERFPNAAKVRPEGGSRRTYTAF